MAVLKATTKNITIAAEIVKKGGLVVYPTETVYGLGCDPFNIQSVKRLMKIKKNRSKPLPVLAGSLVDVEKVVIVSQNAKSLASNFWPGSLTMVLSKKPICLPSSSTTLLSIPASINIFLYSGVWMKIASPCPTSKTVSASD